MYLPSLADDRNVRITNVLNVNLRTTPGSGLFDGCLVDVVVLADHITLKDILVGLFLRNEL